MTRILCFGLAIAVWIAPLISNEAAADDLWAAAKRGDLFSVQRYLKDNPRNSRMDPENIGATDEAGFTALHWAGIRGQWEVFEALVGLGAPVNAVGADGGTPLHWACHHDRPDMVRLLLDRGADLSVQNRWGRTALHVAARRGCELVASLLLSRGADPDAATKEGWTPLHVAYKAGQPRLVGLLLASGADPDREDGEGKKPAEHAGERPAPVEIDPSKLGEYVGRYALGPRFALKVWEERGRLHLEEFAPDELYPVGPDSFYCRQEPWKVDFLRDDGGAVESIEIAFLRRTVRGVKMPERRYVGSWQCAQCHLGRSGDEYLQWQRTRHALAYRHLETRFAQFLASIRDEYKDIEEPAEEWRCRKCHVTAAQDFEAKLAETFDDEDDGVGCEACHGPGSDYMDAEIMSDRQKFLENGGRVPDEETCRQCHEGLDFDYEERRPRILHARADDEPDEG
jgi:hypothetical protein